MHIAKYMQNYSSDRVRFLKKGLTFLSCNPVDLVCPTVVITDLEEYIEHEDFHTAGM